MITDFWLVDGRSGSGKSTYAAALAAKHNAQLLQLEYLYPGWGGLLEGSYAVPSVIHSLGYAPYDWITETYTAAVSLKADQPLVIEGCGTLAPHIFEAIRTCYPGANVRTIWLECAAQLRKARAFARDGASYVPYWDDWAAQENEHIRLHQPLAYAAEIVHAELSDW